MRRRSPTPRTLVLAAVALLAAGCARHATPEEVALEYGRAVYANDPQAIYRLLSGEDRRARDEATFHGQQPALKGVTGEVVRQLASYITATPVSTTVKGTRATVKLTFKLPDANAPEVTSLLLGWDEDRLGRLPPAERARITERIAALHGSGRLPMIEGEETLALVRDDAGWRVFLDWASGVRLRFGAVVTPGLPLEVSVTPAEVSVSPGERVRVTLRAKNAASRKVTTHIGHRIEPTAQAASLALLQCPLFVPITFAPGETREFISVYLVLKDAPRAVKELDVRYEFPAAAR